MAVFKSKFKRGFVPFTINKKYVELRKKYDPSYLDVVTRLIEAEGQIAKMTQEIEYLKKIIRIQ